MLGKLIKYEFKDTYKLFCLYYAILAVLTVLGAITVRSSEFIPSTILTIIMALTMVAYVIMMWILGLITIMALCSRFNKTMYGDRGYLTHTLPVTKASLLASKYVVAIVWCIASVAVMFLSVMIFGSFLSGENLFTSLIFEISHAKWQALDEECREVLGCGLVSIAVLTIIALIVIVMHLLSFLWASISIGQLANEKRRLLSIFAGIGLWFVEFLLKRLVQPETYSTVVDGLANLRLGNGPILHFDQALLITIAAELAFFAIETLLIWFISSKRLNLA